MRAAVLTVCLSAAMAAPATAQEPYEIEALYEALRIPDVLAIMREEGLEYGDELEAELFPRKGGAAWEALVSNLYGVDAMDELVTQVFTDEMQGTDVAPLVEFFASERGRQIVELELEARRALLDESVDEAARETYADMRAQDAPRLALIERFVEVNELVESNVVGALNSNYAFLTGLMDGDALPGGMTEDQVLADVWSQEPEIRDETEEWVFSYLTMAYEPLEDADLRAYIDISETEEGQEMNRALFTAFDEMYSKISGALGAGAARFMAGEDI
ncbi:DUF2059 domain-containing protein [Tranquillimonas alkanivorans]|uniref:Uncharacterized protein n=1 Tax=Tranquillimonas alkanivorans TaxID=441119 RepID=A0A1I5RVQ9_9RHOB|nr:DUF2059 domain-containing protein [Tranquillimonas alkanivorans]SFP62046.1 hypothetical protein SAMN04488047_10992 [Tranquillimonas alkanivorans]